MKKKHLLLGGSLLLFACGMCLPLEADAAAKTVKVTVKYVHSRYGTKLGTKTYKLKKNQKKKVAYASYTGYNKKGGKLTIKGGKKNSTVTVKLSPKKYKYTVQFKNKRTNEIIAKSKHTYTLYMGQTKALDYDEYFDFYGFKEKSSRAWRYDSEEKGTIYKDHSIKQPAKNATKTIEIEPKLVDFYVSDLDKYGDFLYSDGGGQLSNVRLIKRAYFGETITVKPVNYNGYTLPKERKVKISKLDYGDTFSTPGDDRSYKLTYTNKIMKKKVEVYTDFYNKSENQLLGTFEKNFEYGQNQTTIFTLYFGDVKTHDQNHTIMWNKWSGNIKVTSEDWVVETETILSDGWNYYLHSYLDIVKEVGSPHISLVY